MKIKYGGAKKICATRISTYFLKKLVVVQEPQNFCFPKKVHYFTNGCWAAHLGNGVCHSSWETVVSAAGQFCGLNSGGAEEREKPFLDGGK